MPLKCKHMLRMQKKSSRKVRVSDSLHTNNQLSLTAVTTNCILFSPHMSFPSQHTLPWTPYTQSIHAWSKTSVWKWCGVIHKHVFSSKLHLKKFRIYWRSKNSSKRRVTYLEPFISCHNALVLLDSLILVWSKELIIGQCVYTRMSIPTNAVFRSYKCTSCIYDCINIISGLHFHPHAFHQCLDLRNTS